MSHVFISYSKQNKDYARKLAEHLLSQGFDVWIDDQIEPSDEWFKRIVKGIRECAAFLVIMSKEAGSSRWVEREVMLADELQKPMFPVLLNGDLHSADLWALFIGKQYEDARGDKLPGERFYTKLALSAPRKAIDPFDGWTPKFDEPDSDVSEKVIADFTRRHQAFLEERRDQQAASPPDVSHILPPPFEWCVVPAGEVTVRFTPRARAAAPVGTFSISKYPITNSQYQVFVNAQDGYRSPAWWEYSDEARLWRRENKQPQITAFDGGDLPRTKVTWYEAVAFCRWLTNGLKAPIPAVGESLAEAAARRTHQIMLPTEQQWQRAAQGDDGREYPWGNQFDETCCNTTASNIGKATVVTEYPCGISPFGVMDMAGNVWEWCLSEWGTSEVSLTATRARVLRGGSWGNAPHSASTISRYRDLPTYGYDIYGFRIVALALRS
jgi:formylglycine-generating enzyme required for sulfatase activity